MRATLREVAAAVAALTGEPSGRGRSPQILAYAPCGWEIWTITGVDSQLTAGTNTIRLARDTCYAEIDAIYLVQQPAL